MLLLLGDIVEDCRMGILGVGFMDLMGWLA